MQQPGLSGAWETDVGASALPPGPTESSEAGGEIVCVCFDRNLFLSHFYHIFFVLITILAEGRNGVGALTYAHNWLFGHIIVRLLHVLMYQSFLLLFSASRPVLGSSTKSHVNNSKCSSCR